MGQITIYFIGVCTHIESPLVEVPHRAVMVHKEEPWQPFGPDGPTVPLHEPSLSILSGAVASGLPLPSWPVRSTLNGLLQQVRLSILNPVPTQGLSHDDLYSCAIYSLTEISNNLQLQLNPTVAQGGGPPAILYFDVGVGAFSAVSVDHGASAAQLTILTLDDQPQLQISGFNGPVITTIQFQSDSQIIVANEAVVAGDDADTDFIMSYLVTTSLSAEVPILTTLERCPKVPLLLIPDPSPHHDIGPGCSNSAYP